MLNEYIELNMANYDEDQVSQLNAWGIWAYGEIERLQHEVAGLVNELQGRISRDCTMDEVDELMDCIHSDHTFEDLDKHTPADMQTTTGSTIAWLMHRCYAAEMEVQRLKDAKNPLFESGVCGELLAACLAATCQHGSVFQDLDASAVCIKCSKDLGWYCNVSPKHYCEYTDDDECCIHCGAPEERQ